MPISSVSIRSFALARKVRARLPLVATLGQWRSPTFDSPLKAKAYALWVFRSLSPSISVSEIDIVKMSIYDKDVVCYTEGPLVPVLSNMSCSITKKVYPLRDVVLTFKANKIVMTSGDLLDQAPSPTRASVAAYIRTY